MRQPRLGQLLSGVSHSCLLHWGWRRFRRDFENRFYTPINYVNLGTHGALTHARGALTELTILAYAVNL